MIARVTLKEITLQFLGRSQEAIFDVYKSTLLKESYHLNAVSLKFFEEALMTNNLKRHQIVLG
jgi:hypothetical protein